ncbi:centromere protein F [Engraulis encrasicolus]|uniref:centromere protein F n=1 Tax=Engraulis encrasicolus TaxID=184585 RepID=UPI002FD0A131
MSWAADDWTVGLLTMVLGPDSNFLVLGSGWVRMSWAADDWTAGLSGRVLQKVKELQSQQERMGRERQQKQLQLDNAEAALHKHKQKSEEVQRELVALQRELAGVREQAQGEVRARERLAQDLQVRQAQVCNLEGQLEASHTLTNNLNKEIKRLEAELEKLQRGSSSGDSMFSTPCWNMPSPWEHNSSKVEERPGHRGEGEGRLAHVRQQLQFSDGPRASSPLPGQQLRATPPRRSARHSDASTSSPSSSVFPWERDDTKAAPRGRAASSAAPAMETVTRGGHEAPGDCGIEEDLRKERDAQKSVIQELRSWVSSLEKELKGEKERQAEGEARLGEVRRELAAREQGLTRSKDELGRAHTLIGQEREKAQACEQRAKHLQEELKCQRQNAETSRTHAEQKRKEMEREHQRELVELQKERQALEKQHTQESQKLNQELQQARALHHTLQAQHEKLVLQKQALERDLEAVRGELKGSQAELKDSQKKESQTQAKLTEALRDSESMAASVEQLKRKEKSLDQEVKRLSDELADTLRQLKELQDNPPAPPVPQYSSDSFSPAVSYDRPSSHHQSHPQHQQTHTSKKSLKADTTRHSREEQNASQRAKYPCDREPGEGIDSEHISSFSSEQPIKSKNSRKKKRKQHQQQREGLREQVDGGVDERKTTEAQEAQYQHPVLQDGDDDDEDEDEEYDDAGICGEEDEVDQLCPKSQPALDSSSRGNDFQHQNTGSNRTPSSSAGHNHSPSRSHDSPSSKTTASSSSSSSSPTATSELKRENAALRDELQDTKQELQRRLDDLETQRRAEAEARTKLKQLSRKHSMQSEALRSKQQEAQEEAQRLKKELEEERRDAAKLKEALEEKKKKEEEERRQDKGRRKQQKEEVEEKERECERLREALSEMESRGKELEEESGRLREDLETLREELTLERKERGGEKENEEAQEQGESRLDREESGVVKEERGVGEERENLGKEEMQGLGMEKDNLAKEELIVKVAELEAELQELRKAPQLQLSYHLPLNTSSKTNKTFNNDSSDLDLDIDEGIIPSPMDHVSFCQAVNIHSTMEPGAWNTLNTNEVERLRGECDALRKERDRQASSAKAAHGRLEVLQKQVTTQTQQLTRAFESQSSHIEGLLLELQERDSALQGREEELQRCREEMETLRAANEALEAEKKEGMTEEGREGEVKKLKTGVEDRRGDDDGKEGNKEEDVKLKAAKEVARVENRGEDDKGKEEEEEEELVAGRSGGQAKKSSTTHSGDVTEDDNQGTEAHSDDKENIEAHYDKRKNTEAKTLVKGANEAKTLVFKGANELSVEGISVTTHHTTTDTTADQQQNASAMKAVAEKLVESQREVELLRTQNAELSQKLKEASSSLLEQSNRLTPADDKDSSACGEMTSTTLPLETQAELNLLRAQNSELTQKLKDASALVQNSALHIPTPTDNNNSSEALSQCSIAEGEATSKLSMEAQKELDLLRTQNAKLEQKLKEASELAHNSAPQRPTPTGEDESSDSPDSLKGLTAEVDVTSKLLLEARTELDLLKTQNAELVLKLTEAASQELQRIPDDGDGGDEVPSRDSNTVAVAEVADKLLESQTQVDLLRIQNAKLSQKLKEASLLQQSHNSTLLEASPEELQRVRMENEELRSRLEMLERETRDDHVQAEAQAQTLDQAHAQTNTVVSTTSQRHLLPSDNAACPNSKVRARPQGDENSALSVKSPSAQLRVSQDAGDAGASLRSITEDGDDRPQEDQTSAHSNTTFHQEQQQQQLQALISELHRLSEENRQQAEELELWRAASQEPPEDLLPQETAGQEERCHGDGSSSSISISSRSIVMVREDHILLSCAGGNKMDAHLLDTRSTMQPGQSAEESDAAHPQQSNVAPPHKHTSTSAPAPPQPHTCTSTIAAKSVSPQRRTDDSETPASPTDIAADNTEVEPHQLLPLHNNNNNKTKTAEVEKADKDHRLPAGPRPPSQSQSESQGNGAIVTAVAATTVAAKANSAAAANQANQSGSYAGASEDASVTAARTKADGVTLRTGVTARVAATPGAPNASATSSGSLSATRLQVAHQNTIQHAHQRRGEGTPKDNLASNLNLNAPLREACRESSTEGQVKGHDGDHDNEAQEVKRDVRNTSTQTEVTMESHKDVIGHQRVGQNQEVKTISTQTEEMTTAESGDRLTSNGHQRAEIMDAGTQTDAETSQTEEEEEEEDDDELTDSPCPSPDSSAAKDTLLLNSSFPIPSNPAHLADRIRRGRNRMSAAYDDTEYEPYGLPEVVMKGFADIPSGAACPYVLRRGLLGTPAVPLPTPEEPGHTDP